MADTLHNAPIVLDNGSGTIRAGFAGEDLPKCYFPSFVGRPKHLRVLAGALEGDVFIGQRAQELRGLLKIRYPLEHGIVTDWDDMERIWQFVYSEGLKTMSEEVSASLHGFGLVDVECSGQLGKQGELMRCLWCCSIQYFSPSRR